MKLIDVISSQPGRVLDVADLGRMAVFLDPAGAFFGAWQPGTHTGSELVDQAGTQSWVVLPLTTFDAVRGRSRARRGRRVAGRASAPRGAGRPRGGRGFTHPARRGGR